MSKEKAGVRAAVVRAGHPSKVLVTGSSGLIGRALVHALGKLGVRTEGLDVRASGTHHGDVRDAHRVRRAVSGCAGIVHLAAVSRVVWAEEDPEACWSTNVGGLRNVLAAAEATPCRPWVIFASSREVYGQPDSLPVTEEAPLAPVNVYGRSKAEGERLVARSASRGLRACVARLSNVYGSIDDHGDRVVPAFARSAALGRLLRVDGADHTFDFTHLDDASDGLLRLTALLDGASAPPPPIHFVTGQATTLWGLATNAVDIAATDSEIVEAEPRNYDVARFVGDPTRAQALLGWSATTTVQTGLTRLIDDFRDAARAESRQGAAS